MSKSLTPLTVGTQHFNDLYVLANTIVQVLANEIVTANSTAGWGATTTGNGFVFGIFGANTIVAPLLQGGNVATPNTCFLMANLNVNTNVLLSGIININATAITVGANATINSSALFFGNSTANLTINSTSLNYVGASSNATINATGFYYDGIPLALSYNLNITTTGTSTQNVDSWLISSFRAAEYLLAVTDNNANNYEVTKIDVIQSGGAAFSVEYGTVLSNSAMGVFGVTTNSTAVILQFTPTSSNTTVKGVRTNVPV